MKVVDIRDRNVISYIALCLKKHQKYKPIIVNVELQCRV